MRPDCRPSTILVSSPLKTSQNYGGSAYRARCGAATTPIRGLRRRGEASIMTRRDRARLISLHGQAVSGPVISRTAGDRSSASPRVMRSRHRQRPWMEFIRNSTLLGRSLRSCCAPARAHLARHHLPRGAAERASSGSRPVAESLADSRGVSNACRRRLGRRSRRDVGLGSSDLAGRTAGRPRDARSLFELFALSRSPNSSANGRADALAVAGSRGAA